MSLFYTGDVLPVDAFAHLKSEKNCYLVDVRTKTEWGAVGAPDLFPIQKDLVLISWKLPPNMEINKNFVREVALQIGDKEAHLFFICRSGSRSAEAAAMAYSQGYINSYNVIGGFEGTPDGWKASNLLWRLY